jgi:hypothetical protein
MSDSCRSCGSTLLTPVLDLGEQAACDAFPRIDDPLPDPTWPLVAVLCERCGLVQLGGAAAPVPQPPLAVESASHKAHAAATAAAIVRTLGLPAGATVVEFASHHGGSWLPSLHAAGLADAADGADLVVDVHGIAHDEDFDGSLRERVARLAPDGSLVLEFHHLLPLVEQGQFDTVRHGHTIYLSLTALEAALQRYGLHAVDAVRAETFGGSLVVTAARTGDPTPEVAAVLADERRAGLSDATALRGMQERAAVTATALREYLEKARAEGRRVLGYGAPSKAPVLLTWARVGPDLLPFTADLSPAKHGLRLPGVAIPIRSPEDLLAARPDEVLVLTWDIVDEVRAQLAEVASWGGKFVVPQPRLRVL